MDDSAPLDNAQAAADWHSLWPVPRFPLSRDNGRDMTVAETSMMLSKAYAMFEGRISERLWTAGDACTMADCAVLPTLFYADKVVPFRGTHPKLAAYPDQLEVRPSMARLLAKADPYWSMFPFANDPPA